MPTMLGFLHYFMGLEGPQVNCWDLLMDIVHDGCMSCLLLCRSSNALMQAADRNIHYLTGHLCSNSSLHRQM